jgi:hypothetical protein
MKDPSGTMQTIYELLDIHETSRTVEQVGVGQFGLPTSDDIVLVDENGRLAGPGGERTRSHGGFHLGSSPLLLGRGLVIRWSRCKQENKRSWVRPRISRPVLSKYVKLFPTVSKVTEH